MTFKMSMKKALYAAMLMVIAISLSLVMTQSKVNAATYPIITPAQFEQSACIGQNVELKYTYLPAYKTEKVLVEIYNPSGDKVATSEKSFSNYSYTNIDYTVNWDTEGYNEGRYKAVVTMQFYSMLEWREKPTKTTSYINLADHNYSAQVTTAATFGAEGTTTFTCATCGHTYTETIPAVATPKIATKKYVYDGKAQSPEITVKNANGEDLEKGTDYTVSYASDRKSVGEHVATIKLQGVYGGEKNVSFVINPKATELTSVKSGKKQFTVKWKKVAAQATGYEVMYATNSGFTKGKGTKSVANFKTVSKKVTGLKAFNTYYVKVRTYKTVNGTKYYSTWSDSKIVTVRSATGPKLRADEIKVISGNTYTQKLFTAKGKLIKASKVKFSTSKKAVATVNAKGVVVGKKPGTAIITAKYNGKSYKATVVVSSRMKFSKEELTFKNKKSQKITINVKGYVDNIWYDIGDTDIVSCTWGNWKGDNITLTITPKKIGTTKIKINTETTKGGKTDVKYIPVTVLPEWSAECNQKFPMKVGQYSSNGNGAAYTEGTIDTLKIRVEEPYNGRGYIYLDMTGTVTYRKDGWSNGLNFAYQVKDEDGFVIDSGHIFTDAKDVGSRFKLTDTIYLDDPKGKYTVELRNYD